MPLTQFVERPRHLRLHEADNVAIVVNDGGVATGAVFDDGLSVREAIPQSHKVALRPIAEGEAVLRYGQVIGVARRAIAAGSWVKEEHLVLPTAPALDALPRCSDVPAEEPPL